MTAVATPRRVEEAQPPRTRTFTDRLLAAVPLASIYLWLCMVYVFEAWRHVTPWLFTDELETTQISRSIAATGHAARRGEPYHLHSLYPVLLAPVWLIHNVATAYSGVKYLDVFVMTSVIFPTYFLARLVVRRGWALFAAAGAAAIPSLAYSSWIVEETWAYPMRGALLLPDREGADREEPRLDRRRDRRVAHRAVRPRRARHDPDRGRVRRSSSPRGRASGRRSRRASWVWGDYIGFVRARRGRDHH